MSHSHGVLEELEDLIAGKKGSRQGKGLRKMQRTAQKRVHNQAVQGEVREEARQPWARSELQGQHGEREASVGPDQRREVFPEDGLGSGDWDGQLKKYFSSFKTRRPGLVLCLGTKEKCSKIGH